jgi:predicted oxidoreductase
VPGGAAEVASAARVIHAAVDNGITLFDHADIYAYGKSEAVFGEVMKQSPGLRNRIVVQSKCGQQFPPGGGLGDPIRTDLSHQHIVRSVEGSLRRLGTEWLDILLLHVPDALLEPEEIAAAFDHLNRTGKVRHFGVSNHNASQIQLLQRSVDQKIVVNQIRVGLSYPYPLAVGMHFTLQIAKQVYRDIQYPIDFGTVDYCRFNGIQVQAWSPLNGLFGGGGSVKPEIEQVTRLLTEFAQRRDVTPGAVALAWLLRHPAGIVPVIGSTNAEHVAANCAANTVALNRDEWYELLVGAVEL